MPMFQIEQYELHAMAFRVEAQDEADAIARLLDGEAEAVDDGLDFIEVADDFGLPANEHQQLAEKLRDLGVPVDEIISSIRSIEEVD